MPCARLAAGQHGGLLPKVVVIAHRGASGERPEHTLESYELAIQEGADYIEPDLVMTRDGVLIARHENEIGGTTDVAQHPEFATRRRTQVIDGETMTGWFTEDFTLAEIKSLRARERLPELRPGNCAFDGRFTVPTFAEILQLARDASVLRGGKPKVGVYPETKHPAHFASIGLAQEAAVLETLKRFDYTAPGSPVFIQSFDPNNLRQLRGMTRLPLVQLLEYEVGDIARIADYADAIGIAKTLATEATVAEAHARGIAVHAWTFRAENEFLPDDLKSSDVPAAHGDLMAEIERFLARGIDGFFTDFPAIGVRARDAAQATAQSR
jgi:glycerophosphoryl diester phosphodiesterase